MAFHLYLKKVHAPIVVWRSLLDRYFGYCMSARGSWLRKIIEDERKSMISTKNTDPESNRL